MRFDLRGHREIIHDLVFTPDGLTLASASHDRSVRLWSIRNGQELISLTQEGGVYQTAFSADGRIMAVGTYSSRGTNNVFNVHLIQVPLLEEIKSARQNQILPNGNLTRSP